MCIFKKPVVGRIIVLHVFELLPLVWRCFKGIWSRCGKSHWKAARETAKKSGSKVDEEGVEVAVCRHGILFKALNMFRGEIYAYPLFLQKEVSLGHNITFFCTDIMCKYYPYLQKVCEAFPDLVPLLQMKPFLSVMHAKGHSGKCEVNVTIILIE